MKPVIVHLHGIWDPQLHRCALLCRKRGIPYVIAPRGMLEPWSLKQKWLKKRIARFLYQDRDLKKAAALHATAESEAAQFRSLGFRNPVIVSPNGVNLPEGALGVGDRCRCTADEKSLNRRAAAEKKVEEWLAGVDDASFDVALEKFVSVGVADGVIKLRNKSERDMIISESRRFFGLFSNRIIPLSDARCVYFTPDPRARIRGVTNEWAWAEYSVHAVTNGGALIPGKEFHTRWYNHRKTENFDLIVSTVQAERCTPVLRNNPIADVIKFFGETHDGGDFGVVVRLDEYGNAEANLTEVTFEASKGKKRFPRLKPLSEAIEAVVCHQAAGTNPSTDEGSIANRREADKGVSSSLSTPTPNPYTSNNARRALFVSRMHPKKGVLELVESWARVFRNRDNIHCTPTPTSYTYPPWQCELVYTLNGETEKEYEAKVKQRILDLGLSYQDKDGTFHCSPSPSTFTSSPDFIFTGPLDDNAKWQAYARANLFILPTYSENFGIVVAEALWAGLPVITTKGTPWSELEGANPLSTSTSSLLSSPGRCGWWIDLPEKKIGGENRWTVDWPSLDSAIREATNNQQLTTNDFVQMGANGHALVESKYTWSAVIKAMVHGYEQALNPCEFAPCDSCPNYGDTCPMK